MSCGSFSGGKFVSGAFKPNSARNSKRCSTRPPTLRSCSALSKWPPKRLKESNYFAKEWTTFEKDRQAMKVTFEFERAKQVGSTAGRVDMLTQLWSNSLPSPT